MNLLANEWEMVNLLINNPHVLLHGVYCDSGGRKLVSVFNLLLMIGEQNTMNL